MLSVGVIDNRTNHFPDLGLTVDAVREVFMKAADFTSMDLNLSVYLEDNPDRKFETHVSHQVADEVGPVPGDWHVHLYIVPKPVTEGTARAISRALSRSAFEITSLVAYGELGITAMYKDPEEFIKAQTDFADATPHAVSAASD